MVTIECEFTEDDRVYGHDFHTPVISYGCLIHMDWFVEEDIRFFS